MAGNNTRAFVTDYTQSPPALIQVDGGAACTNALLFNILLELKKANSYAFANVTGQTLQSEPDDLTVDVLTNTNLVNFK